MQNQKINQPKLLQSNSRLLRRKLRRLSLRSLRLLSPSRELKVRMMISKLPLISVNPSVEAVVVAEATEVAVEAKEVAVVVTVAAVAAVAVVMASAEDTVVEAVTALSVESALSAMKTVKAVVEVVAEAEAVVEEVVEDSMAIAHKLLLWRAEMLPKVVSQNAELSVEKLVVTDPAITSTALLARLVKMLILSTEDQELAQARKILRRVDLERAIGVMRPSLLSKVRLLLLKEPLKKPRNLAERDVRGSQNQSLKRLKKRKK